MMNVTSQVASLVDELGLGFVDGEVRIAQLDKAQKSYIHHSRVPVALVGYALTSSVFARSRFPKLPFITLIQKRPSMDETEASALAAVCGARDISPPFWGNPAPFGKHLWNVIERHNLSHFFVRLPEDRRYGGTGDHFLLRPRGIDWSDPEQPVAPEELCRWRRDYRQLETVRQLLVATIIQLYLQRDDPYWMVRVPKNWHAADAISFLSEAGALEDWGRLVALYPGW